MELNLYDVITGVVTTSKSNMLYQKLGKITFFVNKLANKVLVRQAVEKIWNVKVRDVAIVNTSSKVRTFARKKYLTSEQKKAIITLKDGYKIDVPGFFDHVALAPQSTSASQEDN